MNEWRVFCCCKFSFLSWKTNTNWNIQIPIQIKTYINTKSWNWIGQSTSGGKSYIVCLLIRMKMKLYLFWHNNMCITSEIHHSKLSWFADVDSNDTHWIQYHVQVCWFIRTLQKTSLRKRLSRESLTSLEKTSRCSPSLYGHRKWRTWRKRWRRSPGSGTATIPPSVSIFEQISAETILAKLLSL